ncbi:22711_t:CDS:2, partial [Gigaspora margarita]
MISYLPTQGSLNSPDSSSPGSLGSPAHSLSVRYPLQEIKQQNDTKANFLEKKKYLDKIFSLGHYPQNVKQTQRSYHLIPNGYIVGVKIRGTDIIAETRYDASDKIIYTITWDSKEKKKSVTSDKYANQQCDEIQKLWDDFYLLYKTMHKINLTDDDIINFENLARKWIKDFCKPMIETKEGTILQEGLYQCDNVNPYIH